MRHRAATAAVAPVVTRGCRGRVCSWSDGALFERLTACHSVDSQPKSASKDWSLWEIYATNKCARTGSRTVSGPRVALPCAEGQHRRTLSKLLRNPAEVYCFGRQRNMPHGPIAGQPFENDSTWPRRVGWLRDVSRYGDPTRIIHRKDIPARLGVQECRSAFVRP